jgi:phosphate transport system substrate-binding protein
LDELTWSQANPLIYRALIGTIVLMVLGCITWVFWPDLLLRECKEYRVSASKFASEVDQTLAQNTLPKWNAVEWEARIEQQSSLQAIGDANDAVALERIRQVLKATKDEMEMQAKSNDPKVLIDPSKGTELLASGNKLKATADQKKHQAGLKEVSNGLETVSETLERLKSKGLPIELERLPELLSLVGERDARINSRASEIEATQRKAEQRLAAINKAPVILRISTTLGIADSLMVPLVGAFVASAHSKNVESMTDGDVRRIHWTDQDGSTQQIEIVQQGDEIGFASLAQTAPDKRSDIHVAFRGPTSAESVALAGIGNLLSSDCAQVIALDAVGILANAGNPVTKLAENQLNDLVSGKIVNWTGVGGQDQPVSLVFPEATGRESVVSASFKKRFAGAESTRTERLVDDSMGQDPGSLGLAAYSTCKRSKILAIQAAERTRILMPSPFTIATEDYKYTVRIIAHHAVKASKATTEFLRFAIGTEGQRAVGLSGYVDLNVKVNSEENDEVIAAIAKKVSPKRLRDAERLSTNLRFETGKAELDIKAQADIRRVVQRLAESDLQDRRLAVLGFADARGGDVVNLPLSEQRAATVADIFISQGVNPSALMGFGARMPVDTNDTDEGMQRNRRVELWILRFQEGN